MPDTEDRTIAGNPNAESPIQDRDRDTYIRSGGVENLDSVPASRPGRKGRSKGADKQNKVHLRRLFLSSSGLLRIGHHLRGLHDLGDCMKCSVDTFAQLHDGSVYVPTFADYGRRVPRYGAVLVRRKWAGP
jgi:hypothetical protein